MKILLNTCEKGVGRIPAVQYTLDHYWPNHPEVIVLGYSRPNFDLGKGYSFVSIAKQDRGPLYWAPDQIEFFQNYDEEYFINWLDDYLLLREADVNMMQYYCDFMLNKDRFDPIDLIHVGGSHSMEEEHWEEVLDNYQYPMATLKRGLLFNLSLHPSIWKTSSYLQALLMAEKEGADIWRFEKMDTERVFNIIAPVGGDKHNIPLYVSEIFSSAHAYKYKLGDGQCSLCSGPEKKRGYKWTSKYKYDGELFDTDKDVQSIVIEKLTRHCSVRNCLAQNK